MGLAGSSQPTTGHRAPGTELLVRVPYSGSLRDIGLDCPFFWGREQSSRYSKLEKADILEMTVRFLQELPASCCPGTAPSE